jgi:hypothetical protein
LHHEGHGDFGAAWPLGVGLVEAIPDKLALEPLLLVFVRDHVV